MEATQKPVTYLLYVIKVEAELACSVVVGGITKVVVSGKDNLHLRIRFKFACDCVSRTLLFSFPGTFVTANCSSLYSWKAP